MFCCGVDLGRKVPLDTVINENCFCLFGQVDSKQVRWTSSWDVKEGVEELVDQCIKEKIDVGWNGNTIILSSFDEVALRRVAKGCVYPG